jgi:hypothetical protein
MLAAVLLALSLAPARAGDCPASPAAVRATTTADDALTDDIDEDCCDSGLEFSVSWAADEVVLTVLPSAPEPLQFGIAEATGCTDCWTGEDSIIDDTPGADEAPHDCHEIGAGFQTLRLRCGGDAAALEPGTTAFDASADGRATCILIGPHDPNCWVWGDDPAYFDGQGCTAR